MALNIIATVLLGLRIIGSLIKISVSDDKIGIWSEFLVGICGLSVVIVALWI